MRTLIKIRGKECFMNRRLLIIGILLLLFGLVSAYESGQQFLGNISSPNNTETSEFLLMANSTWYTPLYFNSSSFMEVGYNSTNTLNFYILNSSAFTAVAPSLNSTNALYSGVSSHEGSGVIGVFSNDSKGVFPYQDSYAGIFPAPNYSAPNSTFLQAGTYYIVFRNPQSSNTLVFYSLFIRPIGALSLTSNSVFGYGLVSGILLIAGFALSVYSLFIRKEPKTEAKITEEKAQQAYAEIEKGKRREGRKRIVRRKRGGRARKG